MINFSTTLPANYYFTSNKSNLISFKGKTDHKRSYEIPHNDLLKKKCTLGEVKDLVLSLVSLRSPVVREHMIGTSIYAREFAKELGLSKQKIDEIELGALLHDVGKIKMPDEFFDQTYSDLQKIKALSKTHPESSYDVLNNISGFRGKISQIAKSHHEHYNGKGYPEKLKGNEIPLAAKIVTIADTFDAITRKKFPKFKPKSFEEAVEYLKLDKSAKRDPNLVAKFLKLVSRNNHELFNQVQRSTQKIDFQA